MFSSRLSLGALRRAQRPTLSVVMPVYRVADYLPEALESVLSQETFAANGAAGSLELVVVDDGSPDDCGRIAEEYAARDPRVRVVHTENRGLGAARNEGVRHARGGLLAFVDGDDVVPGVAYGVLTGHLARSGADFVTGGAVRLDGVGELRPLRWMRRLHQPPRSGIRVADHPEILGDVFAWNKVFRRRFWDRAGLTWPERVRYEDQPTTTRAYLAGRFDVVPDVCYHWRVRDDGSSITQAHGDLADLRDRFATKLDSLDAVRAHGDATVLEIFEDRVLAGDMHRYFDQIPGCENAWWDELHSGVRALWGRRSLVHSGLTPVYRLTGWLVEQGRREDAARVMEYVATHPGPVPRVADQHGLLIEVPGLDTAGVDREALALRVHES